MSDKIVKCKFCGQPTLMCATKMCDPCWEANRHRDWYIKQGWTPPKQEK